MGVPLLAAAVVGAWLFLDDASESRHERERAATREKEQRKAERREELLREQVVNRAHVKPASKPALVSTLERLILLDAHRRVRDGGLERYVNRVECEPHPRTEPRREAEADPRQHRGGYHCLAVTGDIVGVGSGAIGYPFLAKIVYPKGELVWCKINPVPGEQIIPDPRTIVLLPKACR